jgi:hypothetical protein
MKQKKIKLHYTMHSTHSKFQSEFEGFAIKEVDHHCLTYIYAHDDVKTFVCIDQNSIALMRLDDGMTAVWMNEFDEGLIYKSSSMGEWQIQIKKDFLHISDEEVTLSYHLLDHDEIVDTITQTWEEL